MGDLFFFTGEIKGTQSKEYIYTGQNFIFIYGRGRRRMGI
jgi:hypothetical protein